MIRKEGRKDRQKEERKIRGYIHSKKQDILGIIRSMWKEKMKEGMEKEEGEEGRQEGWMDNNSEKVAGHPESSS